jgi:multiple sugar transport system permease protein
VKIKNKLVKIFDAVINWMDTGKKTTVIFLAPYIILFFIFIVVPVVLAMLLSFTYFNGIMSPKVIGISNYIYLLTQDEVFMKTIIPNTFLFAIVVGPGGYILSFFLAWMLSQVPHKPRTIMALIIYSPSLTAGVAMSVLWKVIFSGDEEGFLNAVLLNGNFITEPVQWLQSPDYLMLIMIVVSLWSSMGVGFLAILAGLLNVNKELYEAAYVDGMKNRLQEIIHITIPSIKNQMLFSAVMSVVGTFSAGAIGVSLSGANPTPQNSGQLVLNHIEDYGILRSELGMASALSVILLFIILFFSKFFQKIFGSNE